MKSPFSITVLYNEPHTEHLDIRAESEQDTVTSAKMVADALSQVKGVEVHLCPIKPDSIARIGSITADCIVNLIEWTGRDLPFVIDVFAQLKKLGIPYTGSSGRTYRMTTDKVSMKRAFDRHMIPTPKWKLFYGNEPATCEWPKSNYPAIIKLALEHCGVGLDDHAIVYTSDELQQEVAQRIQIFKQPVIVEQYIDGREFEVSLIDDGKNVYMLPIVEYVFDTKKPLKILTYDAKWNRAEENNVRYEVTLVSFDGMTEEHIRSICLSAYKKLGFTGYGRFDVRMKNNTVYILETNANPGIDDDDDNGLARSFHAVGMTLGDFCLWIIASALFRFGKKKKAQEIRALMLNVFQANLQRF